MWLHFWLHTRYEHLDFCLRKSAGLHVQASVHFSGLWQCHQLLRRSSQLVHWFLGYRGIVLLGMTKGGITPHVPSTSWVDWRRVAVVLTLCTSSPHLMPCHLWFWTLLLEYMCSPGDQPEHNSPLLSLMGVAGHQLALPAAPAPHLLYCLLHLLADSAEKSKWITLINNSFIIL